MHPTKARSELNDANESIEYVEDECDGGADIPTRSRHDVSYVHDFPGRLTRSGLTRHRRARGGARPVLDEAHSPIVFSAGQRTRG